MSRSSRLALYALLAGAVALAPVFAMHGLARRRARERGEAELGHTVEAVLARTDLIFQRADEALRGLQPGADPSCPEHTVLSLRRAVFRDRYIRETGILGADGRLMCTSWGPVASPPLIAAGLRRTPGAPGLEVRGPAPTAIMGDLSVILSLPLAGGGEVNALVDPRNSSFPLTTPASVRPSADSPSRSRVAASLAGIGPGGARAAAARTGSRSRARRLGSPSWSRRA